MTDLDDEQLFDFSAKVKKPKRKKQEKKESQLKQNDTFQNLFSYEQLLSRLTLILEKNNPFANESKNLNLKPVQLEHVGAKKYKWTNFTEFTNILRRNPDHISQFISAEMGIDVIIQDDKLKMEGRRVDKDELQAILKKYIHEYVKCPLCNNANTKMIRDTNIRSMIMQCESCQSQRTVQSIKSGFQSIKKG